jgi:hypothetical protein
VSSIKLDAAKAGLFEVFCCVGEAVDDAVDFVLYCGVGFGEFHAYDIALVVC